jgi:phage terminase large subunit
MKFQNIYKPLFKNHRYKVYYGGRGGGKSWAFARALLLMGCERTIRVLCAREIQRSIADSVHRLLEDQIKQMSEEVPAIAENYTIKKNEIEGKNGTKFNFIGLYTNVNQIKSYEGVDYCWIEEAESISQKSWDLLIPTVRKPDSQIWISFNPARDDDPTYEMFIKAKLHDSIVQKVTWRDNKHFPEVLKKEKNAMEKANYSKYLHIWEGEPICNYDSLVYRFKRDINLVDHEIKYNEGFETWASWDFGVGDDTAIIFYQLIPVPMCDEFPKGFQIHIFDEYCNNNEVAEHYREVVDSKGYLIDRHACDPAGASRGNDLKSWLDKLKVDARGRKPWHFEYSTYYHGKVDTMIDNANDWIHAVRINRHQCPKTVAMFEKWQYRTDKDDKLVLPLKCNHDDFSHLGTSFYFFCINRFTPGGKQKVRVL